MLYIYSGNLKMPNKWCVYDYRIVPKNADYFLLSYYDNQM